MDSDTKFNVGDLVLVYYVGFDNSKKNMGIITKKLTYREIVDLVGPSDAAVDSYNNAGTFEVYDLEYKRRFVFHGEYLVLLSSTNALKKGENNGRRSNE